MNKESDIEGHFHLFDTAQSGKQTPVLSGYIPVHKLYDNYLSSGKHEYPDVHCVAPGETAKVRVCLITPEVCAGCLWIGREIDVMEGVEKVVGKLTVTRIFNEILSGDADSYSFHWIKPSLQACDI
jgi:translation elongation factor EF-Tu-like GTPase